MPPKIKKDNDDPYAKYKITLEKTERERYEKLFSSLIKTYYDSMEPRLTRIRDWRDRYDMEVESVDYPFKDAKNQTLVIVPLAIDGVHSEVHSMLWESDNIIKAYTENKEFVKEIAKAENYANHLLKRKIKIQDKSEDAEFNTYEDGTGILEVFLNSKYSREKSTDVYNTMEEFTGKFPDAESAGLEEKKYDDYIKKFKKGKVEIPTLRDKMKSFGADVGTVEREDFIMLPANSVSIEKARGCGKKFIMSASEIEDEISKKRFDAEDDEWKKVAEIGGQTTSEEQQQERRTGVQRDEEGLGKADVKEKKDKEQTDYEKEYYMVELIYKCKKGNDLIARDYWFTMVIAPDYGKTYILRVMEPPEFYRGMRKYAELVFWKRKSKQFDGISFPYKLRHVDDTGQMALNLWLNWYQIKMRPPLKVDIRSMEDEADNWDIGLMEFWYMTDPDNNAIPLDVGGTSPPESMAIIAHQEKMGELLIGMGAHLSGKESPTDPRAPASKTFALMREGRKRIRSGAKKMVKGLNKVIKMCLYIEYAIAKKDKEGGFTQDFIKGYDKKGTPEIDTITNREYNLEEMSFEINFEMATAVSNREIDKDEFLRVAEILYKSDPDMQQDPFVRGAVRNYILELYQSPLRHVISLTPEEIEERQARIMARATQIKEEQERAEGEDLENKINEHIKTRRQELTAEGVPEEKQQETISNELVEIKGKMDEDRRTQNAGREPQKT